MSHILSTTYLNLGYKSGNHESYQVSLGIWTCTKTLKMTKCLEQDYRLSSKYVEHIFYVAVFQQTPCYAILKLEMTVNILEQEFEQKMIIHDIKASYAMLWLLHLNNLGIDLHEFLQKVPDDSQGSPLVTQQLPRSRATGGSVTGRRCALALRPPALRTAEMFFLQKTPWFFFPFWELLRAMTLWEPWHM